jgi:hypothetical protein
MLFACYNVLWYMDLLKSIEVRERKVKYRSLFTLIYCIT